jgi:hypothetical protein
LSRTLGAYKPPEPPEPPQQPQQAALEGADVVDDLDPETEAAISRLHELNAEIKGGDSSNVEELAELVGLLGDESDVQELRQRGVMPRAERARQQLRASLANIEAKYPETADTQGAFDRLCAMDHAYGTHLDDLDPEHDQDLIEAGRHWLDLMSDLRSRANNEGNT